ncbi:O-antigen ligase family protein [Marinobacter flavimaris]|uniref:O-antigen ligase family protein n=1 Tax=Marinobacter flavimaris TaxID=262076 RepID=UPI0038689A7D
MDFFLHLSQRIPGYGVLRPTLLLVALISGLLFLQKDRIKDRTNDPIFKAILVLLGYMIVSWPLVEYQGSVIRHNLPEFVKAIVFVFFTALIVDTKHRLKLFLLVFVSCQVIRVLEPLYMNLTQDYWGSATHLGGGEFANRLSGAPSDVINPNELGFVIATAAPFLHYLLFTGRWKAKLLYLALAPCLLYAMILTMSRGGILALAVVGWFIFKESRHKLVLILVAIGIGMGGWSIMNPVQKDRYLSIFVDDAKGSSSASGRIGGIIGEFKLGLNRPVVGHGVGTTPEVKANNGWGPQASHNMYGELLIEIGIVGFALFIRYIIQIYRRFMKNREIIKDLENNPDNAFYHNLNKALIAVFWMYAVYSLNYWGLSQYYWYLFGGMAIAFGHVLSHEISEVKTDPADKEKAEPKYSLAWSVRNRAG